MCSNGPDKLLLPAGRDSLSEVVAETNQRREKAVAHSFTVQRNTYAGTGSGTGGTGAGSGVGSGSGGCGSGSGTGLGTTSGPPAVGTSSGVMNFPSDECRNTPVV